jgi:hypothetical protein
MQWLKRYFDLNYNGEPYDAVGRRKGQDFYYLGAAPTKGISKPTTKKPAPTATKTVAAPVKPKPTVVGVKKADAGGKGSEEIQ